MSITQCFASWPRFSCFKWQVFNQDGVGEQVRSCCTFAIWLVSTTSFILGWIFVGCSLADDICELLVSMLAPDTKKRSLCHPLMDTNDKRNFYCELNLIVTQLSIWMIRRKKVDTSDIKSQVLTYFQSAEATICCLVSAGACCCCCYCI